MTVDPAPTRRQEEKPRSAMSSFTPAQQRPSLPGLTCILSSFSHIWCLFKSPFVSLLSWEGPTILPILQDRPINLATAESLNGEKEWKIFLFRLHNLDLLGELDTNARWRETRSSILCLSVCVFQAETWRSPGAVLVSSLSLSLPPLPFCAPATSVARTWVLEKA